MKELIRKTGLLMLMLVAGLAFASCSDDDEGSNPSDLVGAWTVTSNHYTFYKNGTIDEEYIDDEIGEVWEINADGTISAMNGFITGTWTVKGNQLLVTEVSEVDTYVYRFTLTRNGSDEITLHTEETYTEMGNNYRDVCTWTLSRN